MDKLPRHVAVIMDGNGRWAKKKGLPRTAGHAVGAETFRKIALAGKKIGLEYLTVYAFSTENWKRPQEEVKTIMNLLGNYLRETLDDMEKNQVKVKFFGDMSAISPELRELISEAEEKSAKFEHPQVNICLNYGGRDEILHAAKKYAEIYKETGEELTEEVFSNLMYSAGVPDPELIIRPSGELRLSNFLLWQAAYSEFYFTDVLWPDFGEDDFLAAIADFQGRNRRFGGVK